MKYVELQVTTNYTFLVGGSHPGEIITEAAKLGYSAIAITDRNTLAGMVRAYAAAKQTGIKLIIGCRLDLTDGVSLLVYPKNLEGYGDLCALLTTGNRRTEKGKCLLRKEDVYGLKACKFIVVPPSTLEERALPEHYRKCVLEYAERFSAGSMYLAMSRYYLGDDTQLLYRINELADEIGCPIVAVNDVHYHSAERRQLQDVLTCIREKCTIQNAGFRLLPNAERHLKAEKEMERLFRQYPKALQSTIDIAAACQFSL
ncbi:PHP domain-containing protein [Chitinophaga terrae (ex Kim and Jung 2007)]|uniref:PHP domain-containing protein n=1 Tax=Chitinophaga terrae (ex Kim and Jung 2007) TaxID=408074 RepID=A0A1H4GBM4_9BACT|nr:PHP domain-containing protein [Chitinophaga terrae (ex Kim and Jung 2007)]GEP93290.1 hypothetical protein CTE07_49350 [Chitinophaga terrae (ex Kim and Jung 2007)]SEB06999.1 PHP domain-containing protein [Chitinophaga terrae (ex Kim and Jung 2007)]